MADAPQIPATGIESTVSAGLPKRLLHVIALIRAKLRDYPELNRLLSGVETSDREIAFAIMEAIDDFNITPPLIGPYTLSTFPSITLLINGAIINILASVGMLQDRNNMMYSDGQGVQVGVSDKGPRLMAWIQLFSSQYEQKKFRLKQALNLRGALNGSGVTTEYTWINGYFDELE